MAILTYYAVSAVVFSNATKHHHSISHIFVHGVYDNGMDAPGRLFTRVEALDKMKTVPFFTIMWNYTEPAKWQKGAQIIPDEVNGITYLRTKPDNTTRDNLKDLIEYRYFVNV